MLGMPFFGTGLHWVYNFQTFILVLTLPIFFLALRVWTKNDYLSLLATALLANCPILLFLSRASSPEGLYVFLISLSLLFLKWACDRNTTRHWLLLALLLAFFAQTRPETILCLSAFIAVAFIKITKSQKQELFPFSAFLATLSFFSIPILCTISLGRDSKLQGGAYSAHGHLFENIIANFKLMAFHSNDNIANQNFMPYFTWLALFGLITLIILTIRELLLKNKFPSNYAKISTFILLLSPQYLLLFDVVSADFNLQVQQRFILVILPIMAFFGALFLYQIGIIFGKIKIFSDINTKIPLLGILAIIISNTLLFYETFKRDFLINSNTLLLEDRFIRNWIKKEPQKRKLLFYANSPITISYGISSYAYSSIFKLNKSDVEEMLEEYNGEVYFLNGNACKPRMGVPKMITGTLEPICGRFETYYKTELVTGAAFGKRTDIKIYRIIGLTDRDTNNLLKIFNRSEVNDSMIIEYMMPKKEPVPWKIQRLVNDSLIMDSEYKTGYGAADNYPFSVFNRDTNRIDMRIIDTITGEQVHSDYWKLLKVR